MSVVTERCPGCGHHLEYDVKSKKMICEYCKKEYVIEELSLKDIDTRNIESYHCPNCGADILCTNQDITSNCVYCDSPVILGDRISGEFQPDYIIPFEHTKEEIIGAFSQSSFRKLFPVTQYFKKENIISLEGMYIPYWLVSSEVSVFLNGAIPKDDNMLCFFERRGTMSFDKVPAVAKTTLKKEDLATLEPFNYSNLKPFLYPYLSGFYAEKYDTSETSTYEQEMKDRMEKVALYKISRAGKNRYEKNISHKKIKIFCSKFDYALVPIWILKVRYKGKVYTNYMNDQNFHLAGNIPTLTKKKKMIKVIIFIIFILFFFIAGIFNKIFWLILILFPTISIAKKPKRQSMDEKYIDGVVNIIEDSESIH